MTISTAQTANTLGKGGFQVGLEGGLQGHAVVGSPSSVVFAARGDVAIRYGATEKIDVALRAGSTGLEGQLKLALTDPAQTGFVASVAPSVGGYSNRGLGSPGGLFAQVPLLMGFGVGNGHQIIVAPKLLDTLILTSVGARNSLFAGMSLGFAWRITSGLRLLPELSAVYPLISTAAAGTTAFGAEFPVQLGLALLVGGA